MPEVMRKNYKWIILVVVAFIYSTGYLVRWNYTGISSYLTQEWAIGKPELGIIGSAFYYAYAVGQGPWGTWSDMYGGRRIIPLGIILSGLVLASFAYTQSYTQGLVARTVLGLVAGTSFSPCLSLISKWFGKKERGLAMNLFSGPGGGLGEVGAFLLMPIIALFTAQGYTVLGLGTWRAATMVMALYTIILGAIGYIALRNDPSEIGLESIQAKEDASVQKVSYKEAVFEALKDPWYWLISIAWCGHTVALRVVPGWLPIYAAAWHMQNKGFNAAEAMVAGGVVGTIYVAGRMIGAPVMGKFSDYLMRNYSLPRLCITAFSHLMVFIGLFCLTIKIDSVIYLWVLAAIFGVFINTSSLVPAATTEIWSIKTSGILVAFENMVGQFAGAFVLSISGFMAVKYSVKGAGVHSEYLGIWYLGMVFLAIACITATFAIKRERKAIKEKGIPL